MTPAAVGAYLVGLSALAAAWGGPGFLPLVWSPLAAATVLFVALRHLGAPPVGAFVAGLAWGAWPGRLTGGDDPGLHYFFLFPLALLALHRLVAGRRVRHVVEFGLLVGLQAAIVGASGVVVLVGALAAVLGLSAAVGRWRSRTTLTGLAAATLVVTAVLVIANWLGATAPLVAGAGAPAAGWWGVASALARVPGEHVIYGRSGLLPTGVVAAFPGVVVLALGVWGWRRAHSLGLAPLAASAVGLCGGSLVAMAWLVPHDAMAGAASAFLLGLAVLTGLGAAAIVGAAPGARRAVLMTGPVVVLIWLEALCVRPSGPAAAPPERMVYSGVSSPLSPGFELPLERP